MTTSQEIWRDSPARTLTMGNYLPVYDEPTAPSPIQNEIERQDSVIDLVNVSGDEFGRTSQERLAYIGAAGERYGRVNLLQRAYELSQLQAAVETNVVNLDMQTDEVKDAIIQDILALQRLNERLFGAIDKDRMGAIVARARAKAQTIIEASDDAELTKAAHRLLARLPDADPTLIDKHIYKPSPELLSHWKPYVERKYADLLELVSDDEETYNAQAIRTHFEVALKTFAEDWGLPRALEWKVAFGKTNINVDLETKTIWVPESREVSASTLRELLVHEIGGHLLRNLVGELSGDPLLATDMPGREVDEESLLVAMQQTLSGKTRESGIDYYLAIGLSNGTLDTSKRVPNSELYDVMRDYKIVENGNMLPEKASVGLRRTVFRVTRGMPSIVIDGVLHQSTYNADLKYAIGQHHAVTFLEANRDNPAALDEAMYGKFAYSRPEQLTYARTHTRISELRVPVCT